MGVTMSLQNVDKVIKVLEERGKRAKKNLSTIMREVAEIVLEKALYYVPRDTQLLADSGRIVIVNDFLSTGQEFAEMWVSFGNQVLNQDGVNYAIYVHEDLSLQHEFPTCAKFLARGYRETRKEQRAVLGRLKKAQDYMVFTKTGPKGKSTYDYGKPK